MAVEIGLALADVALAALGASLAPSLLGWLLAVPALAWLFACAWACVALERHQAAVLAVRALAASVNALHYFPIVGLAFRISAAPFPLVRALAIAVSLYSAAPLGPVAASVFGFAVDYAASRCLEYTVLSKALGSQGAAPLPPLSFWEGFTTHSRTEVAAHSFRYPVWMQLLDIDRPLAPHLPAWLYSPLGRTAYFAQASDGYGQWPEAKGATLGERVRALVAARTGAPADDTAFVYLLTTPQTLGHCFNPISVYYCYSRDGALRWCVSEVTSTPWGERTSYVARMAGTTEPKSMHVSPFISMAHSYSFRFGDPLAASDTQPLAVTIRVQPADFTAYLALRPVDPRHHLRFLLARMLGALPPAFKTLIRIHWEAALLFLAKRVPFLPHPKYAACPADAN